MLEVPAEAFRGAAGTEGHGGNGHGASRLDDANACLRQSLLMSVLISALVCGLSFLFARPYIQFAGAQADTIELAVQYFRIVIIGQFFAALARKAGGGTAPEDGLVSRLLARLSSLLGRDAR